MSIVLIGYRGSGKTTLGRMLAERTGREFVDADDRIVARAGKSIARIFAEEGETAFRDLETAVLAEILQFPNHVIAVGGGALDRAENRRALSAGRQAVVY